MSIGDLMITNKHTHSEATRYYTVDVSVEPPTYAKDIKDCGCYNVVDFNETDRCWMSHTTTVTHHYLCSEHMEEYQHNQRISEQRYHNWLDLTACKREMNRQEREKQHQEERKLADEDKLKMFSVITSLEIPRLKKIKLICEGYGWKCDIHRGMICVWSRGGLGKFNYKRTGVRYVFSKYQVIV